MKNNTYNKGISSILIIIIAVLVIAAAGVGGYYLIKMWPAGTEMPETTSEDERAAEEAAAGVEEEIPEDESTIDRAWRVYSSISAAFENKDSGKINNLFYFLSVDKIGNIQDQIQMCQSQGGLSEDECLDLLKKNMVRWEEKDDFVKTFTRVEEDSYQITLIGETQLDEGRFQLDYLFFVKDPQNQKKIYILMSGYTAGSTLGGFQDSDNDGYTDDQEICSRSVPGCVETDPNLKDTDGDGWWDSIEGVARTDPNDIDSHPF